MTRKHRPTLSLVLVDATSPTRSHLRTALSQDPAFCLAGEAETGSAGLDLFFRYRPDVLLVGIDLPDQSGFEVLARVRETDPGCPVILLSNSADPFVEYVGRQLGANEVWPRSGRFSLIREMVLAAGRAQTALDPDPRTAKQP
jgi:DNA-binding NarL/FixJ family response regulator